MHIAICDDNVADRKQTERLMGREADKWIAKGSPLYIYSYGSVTSLVENAMKFDAIVLDVSGADATAYAEILQSISKAGIDGVIIYSNPIVEEVCGERNIFFLPKPINASLLHESLVKTEEISAGAVKLIELRGLKETLYVTDEEIRYAIQVGEYTDVTLTGDRCIRIHGDPGILYDEIRGQHEVFVMASYSTVLNVRHVAFIGPMSVRMCDGKKFAAGSDVRAYVRHKMNK